MAEFLALNKPPVLVMDIRASENSKKFKQKYEVYAVATGVKEKWKKVQAAVLKNLVKQLSSEKPITLDHFW